MPFRRLEIGPAVRTEGPQGDDSRLETKIRLQEKARQEVAQAAHDLAEGRISKDRHDSILRGAKWRLDDDPLY
jgi:hypothetical protein